jgi:hypothetical protein
MKTLTLLAATTSMTATAFADTTAEVMTPTPPSAPTLGGWFVGGTYGQSETGADLGSNFQDYDQDYKSDDVDFDLYTVQLGRDLGMQVLGCDLAAYLEVGFAQGDGTIT